MNRLNMFFVYCAVFTTPMCLGSAMLLGADEQMQPIFIEGMAPGVHASIAEQSEATGISKGDLIRMQNGEEGINSSDTTDDNSREIATSTITPSSQPSLPPKIVEPIQVTMGNAVVLILNNFKDGVDRRNRSEDQEKIFKDMETERSKLEVGESKEFYVHYLKGRYHSINPTDEDTLLPADKFPSENTLPWTKVTVTRTELDNHIKDNVLDESLLRNMYENTPQLQKQFETESEFLAHVKNTK
ncbi:hypothetical protein ACEV76_08115 [Vibrio parahaemolyticus]|uniref:hypothetical protein n=2 Tax=Vibrio parahaemolyticus TaxID=670 RepID=UPI000A3A4FE5|nr:hypothetical protein [Vibrio parahaemolyticus]EJG0323476.1 hypothetical protein [Vibrio parahaemolyticus]MBE4382486.1 hypothetical protein [Vibrio parahaemolyticus]OUJ62828.1 hypothetical protein BTO03_03915 [Vibrio parahaemolyticus]TOA41241.1 hypothetical protein CGK28_05540 [Vibrio parahaemolyticus]HCE1966553.1 hypothetical protein [Vibrio parahaemolyticus]